MTPEELKQNSEEGVDAIIPAVAIAMEKLGDLEAFDHITSGIMLTNIALDNAQLVMAGGYAEALMRLAKLATPASLPATTLAE
jgi:hypothetical protein